MPEYFRLSLVRKGPEVPARRGRFCQCTINGEDEHEWRHSCDRYPAITNEINGREVGWWRFYERAEIFGISITKGEFDYMTALAAWCKKHDPSNPVARPYAPILVEKPEDDKIEWTDYNTLAPVF